MPRPNSLFTENVIELMPDPEEITARRMFGGVGLFRSGLMFGIIDGEELYLKTDTSSRDEFESKGLAPLTFQKKTGKTVTLSYHLCPEQAFQRSETMKPWAQSAFEAAVRQSNL